ncbi:hypothetical protein MMC12_002317 [Toensbergia leucococca]|nr:hypothetical protein [Toensbergia leucococca]
MTEPSPQLSPQTTHLPPLVGLSLEELDSDGDLGNGDGNGSPSAKSDQSLISGAIPLKKLPAIGADTLHPGIRLISVLGMLSPTALWKQWRRAPDIIIPKVDDFRIGYPRLAAFVESDPNFVEYRQYRYLRHRCMLHLQDELSTMERKLHRLDADDHHLNLKSRNRDDNQKWPKRKELLANIQNKLQEYDDMLFRARELMKLKKPTNRNRRSYSNYIQNHQLLAGDDREFIRHGEDLVALGGDLEDSWFNGIVEETMKTISKPISKLLFQTKVQRYRTDDKLLTYFAKTRLDTLARLVLTVIGTLLLMIPVFVLYAWREDGVDKDMVVLVFTFVFAIFLAIFTRAKRHEVFAATAGYVPNFQGNTSFSTSDVYE